MAVVEVVVGVVVDVSSLRTKCSAEKDLSMNSKVMPSTALSSTNAITSIDPRIETMMLPSEMTTSVILLISAPLADSVARTCALNWSTSVELTGDPNTDEKLS